MKKRYMAKASIKGSDDDYNVECDRCGYWLAASLCQKEWTGWFVCKKCWEPRHPQEFLKLKPEQIAVPVARPDTGVPTEALAGGDDLEQQL